MALPAVLSSGPGRNVAVDEVKWCFEVKCGLGKNMLSSEAKVKGEERLDAVNAVLVRNSFVQLEQNMRMCFNRLQVIAVIPTQLCFR